MAAETDTSPESGITEAEVADLVRQYLPDEADEATPEADAAPEKQPDEGAGEGDGKAKDADPIDKELQQRQQNVANREKAVMDAEKRIQEATERLEKLAAKFEANPTAANAKAVEQAQQDAKDDLSEIEAAIADPSKFDAFADSPKLIKALVKANRDLRDKVKAVEKIAEGERQSRIEAANQNKAHETYWNGWAQKNADIGRDRGEEIWADAVKEAEAEVKAAKEDEGLDLSPLETAKQIFRRLLKEERAAAKEASGKERVPPKSGGRMGPGAGRSSGAPARPGPQTHDEMVRDLASKYQLS